MELHQNDNWNSGPAEIADGGAREPRDAIERWWALAARLVAFAITLFIVTILLQALQIAVWHADGSVDVFAQPAPGEQQVSASEALVEGTAPRIAEIDPAEGRMYDTEEARRWMGNYTTSAPRTVY